MGKESPTKEGRQQWEQLFEEILNPFSNFQQNRRQSNNTQKNNEISKLENVPKFIQNNSINNCTINLINYDNENNENTNSYSNLASYNNNLLLFEKNLNRQTLSLIKNNQNGKTFNVNCGEYELFLNTVDEISNENDLINNKTAINTKCPSTLKSKLSISTDTNRIGNGTSAFIVPANTISCNGTAKNINDSLVIFIIIL